MDMGYTRPLDKRESIDMRRRRDESFVITDVLDIACDREKKRERDASFAR